MTCYIVADIAAAFPILAHEFIFIVLRAIGAPLTLYNYVVALYLDNLAMDRSGKVWFLVLAGVLQGCGMSGSLFALCFDPILRMLEASVDLKKKGLSRGCADDVGVVVRQLSCFLSRGHV